MMVYGLNWLWICRLKFRRISNFHTIHPFDHAHAMRRSWPPSSAVPFPPFPSTTSLSEDSWKPPAMLGKGANWRPSGSVWQTSYDSWKTNNTICNTIVTHGRSQWRNSEIGRPNWQLQRIASEKQKGNLTTSTKGMANGSDTFLRIARFDSQLIVFPGNPCS